MLCFREWKKKLLLLVHRERVTIEMSELFVFAVRIDETHWKARDNGSWNDANDTDVAQCEHLGYTRTMHCAAKRMYNGEYSIHRRYSTLIIIIACLCFKFCNKPNWISLAVGSAFVRVKNINNIYRRNPCNARHHRSTLENAQYTSTYCVLSYMYFEWMVKERKKPTLFSALNTYIVLFPIE